MECNMSNSGNKHTICFCMYDIIKKKKKIKINQLNNLWEKNNCMVPKHNFHFSI